MQLFKTIQTVLFLSCVTQLAASEYIDAALNSVDRQQPAPTLKRMRLNSIAKAPIESPYTMPFTIPELKSYLVQSICGQDDAMERLATAVHTHLLRQKINQSILDTPEQARAEGYITTRSKNILLAGQSGSGKTTILTCLRTFLQKHQRSTNFHFPIIFQNYESDKEDDSLKNTLASLIYLGDYTLSEMEHAIIFLDDMDLQLFSQDTEKESVSRKIQSEWLPMLEGVNLQLKITNEDTSINLRLGTENMLFIGTAAFSKQAQASMPTRDRYDLEEAGFLPAFIETFQSPIQLEPFNKYLLFNILNKPDSPHLRAAKTVLKAGYDISLTFTPDALKTIAAEASKHPRSIQQMQATLDTLAQSIMANAEIVRGQTITITDRTIQALPLLKSRREKFDERFPGYIS